VQRLPPLFAIVDALVEPDNGLRPIQPVNHVERDAVLLEVPRGLGPVPLELHAPPPVPVYTGIRPVKVFVYT